MLNKMNKLLFLLPFFVACSTTTPTPSQPEPAPAPAPTCDASGDQKLIAQATALLAEDEAMVDQFITHLGANDFEACKNAGANGLHDEFVIFVKRALSQVSDQFQASYEESKNQLNKAVDAHSVCTPDDVDKVQDAMFTATANRLASALEAPLQQCHDVMQAAEQTSDPDDEPVGE